MPDGRNYLECALVVAVTLRGITVFTMRRCCPRSKGSLAAQPVDKPKSDENFEALRPEINFTNNANRWHFLPSTVIG
jgi:hypothetical protein